MLRKRRRKSMWTPLSVDDSSGYSRKWKDYEGESRRQRWSQRRRRNPVSTDLHWIDCCFFTTLITIINFIYCYQIITKTLTLSLQCIRSKELSSVCVFQVLCRSWSPTLWFTGLRSRSSRTLSWCGSCSVCCTDSMTLWESWSALYPKPTLSMPCPCRTPWSCLSVWARSARFWLSRWALRRRGSWSRASG